MIKTVTTSSGFVCEINEDALDDMEVIDSIVSIDGGDISGYPVLIRKVLGDDGKKKLYDHLRTPDGRVPREAFGAEISDIFNALGSGKK